MTLRKEYNKGVNQKPNIPYAIGACIGVSILVGITYGMSLLYNYVGIAFGLPKLNFLQFLGTVVFVDVLLLHFHTLKGVKKDNNQIQLVQLKNNTGDYPDEL